MEILNSGLILKTFTHVLLFVYFSFLAMLLAAMVHCISFHELCFCLGIRNYRACTGYHVAGVSVYSKTCV